MPYHRPIPGAKQTSKPVGIIGAWIQAEKLMQIALVLPCSVFIGWLAGAWLDRRLHQSWIAIAGLVFGGISGMVYVVRLVFAVNKDPAMQDEDSGGSADNNKAGKGSAGFGS